MRDDVRGGLAVAILLLGTPTWPSAAAEPAVEAVSFDDAVHGAIESNHDVARASSAILSAEGLFRRARAAILPSVVATGRETRYDEERSFDGVVTQPRDQLVLGASASVPVLSAAQWAAKAQAADRVEVARLAAADVRKQVAAATAQAYLAVIAAHRQVEVDERARDNAKAQLEYARTRFEGGGGSRLDMLRASEVLATDEVLAERSRLVLTLSQEALGVLMAADRPIDAAGEPAFDVPPPEASEDLSLRTDIRLFTARRDLADRVVRDSWKDYLPVVVASVDQAYVDPANAFQESSSWRAALGVSFPIYLGGERKADRVVREAALDAARIDLDEGELRARADVRAARAAIEASERGLERAHVAAESANEVLRITDLAFRAGARTNIELVDAQRRARDSETAAARAEDLLRQAKLDLLVALGLFP